MIHSFRLSAAKAFGVEEAIMLNNLIFWMKKNQTNGRHFNDGRTWTYNTLEAFTLQFEYWTLKQIRRILDNLEKSGVIVTGRYNKKGYDKTKWYALFSEDMTADDFDFYEWVKSHCPNGQTNRPNGQKKLPKRANQNAQKGSPIPDILSDNITDVSFSNEKGFHENSTETIGDVAAEFQALGEPSPVKARKKKTPPKLRATPPANYIYEMYEAWAQFVEAKGIPVARTASGNYQLQGKEAKALKDMATWLMNMPGDGTAVERWRQFVGLAWGKADKFIRNNFTPEMLNSKRMNIVMVLNAQAVKDREYVEMAAKGFDFDAYLRGEIEIEN